MSTSTSAFARVESPDQLVQRLRFDVDPLPTDENGLLAFLKRDEDLQQRLRAHLADRELPFGGIRQQGGTITVTPLDTFLEPGLNPYLVLENIGVARSLLSDCLELRRRIEALQLDLFNFSQESYEYDESKKFREEELDRLRAEIRLQGDQLTAKQNEQRRFATMMANWTTTMTAFGPDNAGWNVDARASRAEVQSCWSLFYSASSDGAPQLQRVSNAPAANPFGSDPFGQVRTAVSSEARRSANFEATNQRNETLRLQNDGSMYDAKIQQLQVAKSQAEAELSLAEKRNAIRDEKWRRKVEQFRGDAGLGLQQRLGRSLLLYKTLVEQLRVALHAIELGQSEVLGLTIDGFDAARLDLRNRYLLEPSETDEPPSADGFGQVGIPVNRMWISLDTLARYLVQAETRMRHHAQTRTVRQTVFRLDGAFQEGVPELKIEQDLGGHAVFAAPEIRRNILAIRILNLGDPVGLRLYLRAPEPLGTLEPPTLQNPHGTHVPDPVWKALSKYNLSLGYEYLPPTATALAAEVPACVAQFLNRDLSGTLTATMTRGEPTAQRCASRYGTPERGAGGGGMATGCGGMGVSCHVRRAASLLRVQASRQCTTAYPEHVTPGQERQ